jgi:hypothetical protein
MRARHPAVLQCFLRTKGYPCVNTGLVVQEAAGVGWQVPRLDIALGGPSVPSVRASVNGSKSSGSLVGNLRMIANSSLVGLTIPPLLRHCYCLPQLTRPTRATLMGSRTISRAGVRSKSGANVLEGVAVGIRNNASFVGHCELRW